MARRKSGIRIYAPGALPLVVGVTGHRDLVEEDRGGLVKRVTEALVDLQDQYPATPLRILTLLAAGADCLVAEAALAVDLEVIGVLPMDLDQYRSDFSGDDLVRFESLLSRCAKIYTLPLAGGQPAESIAQTGPARDYQYAAAGEFLVRQCQYLMALWDGTDTHLNGGTSDILRTQLCSGYDRFQSSAGSIEGKATGPVYWLPTRRRKDPKRQPKIEAPWAVSVAFDQSKGPQQATVLYPSGWETPGEARNHYRSQYGWLDSFNRDRAKRLVLKSPLSLKTLLQDADALAVRFQRKTHRAFLALVGFGAFAFGLMVLFDQFDKIIALLMAFFATLAVAWGTYHSAKSLRWNEKYFDYRTLAELARLQNHWRISGMLRDPAEFTSTKQRALLPWVEAAVRTASLDDLFGTGSANDLQAKALVEDWVSGQKRYYSEKLVQRRRSLKVRKAVRLGLFLTALVAALSFFPVWWSAGTPFALGAETERIEGLEVLLRAIQTAFELLVSVGAALALFMNYRAYEDEVRLFERGKVVFTRAEALMNQALEAGDLQTFMLLAVELAREAVGEHFEWNADHRSVPLEMPMG